MDEEKNDCGRGTLVVHEMIWIVHVCLLVCFGKINRVLFCLFRKRNLAVMAELLGYSREGFAQK